MTLFADTSILFAAANERDRMTRRARQILAAERFLVTTDHVVVETWRLLRDRLGWELAERWCRGLLTGPVELESVRPHDLEAAQVTGRAFPDQAFSLVDRTSFAVMERLGVRRVATLDDDFVVYRFGPKLNRAFEILR